MLMTVFQPGDAVVVKMPERWPFHGMVLSADLDTLCEPATIHIEITSPGIWRHPTVWVPARYVFKEEQE